MGCLKCRVEEATRSGVQGLRLGEVWGGWEGGGGGGGGGA